MGQRDRMFKVLVVGDATVGKTSLVQRYANDSFNRHYKSTVGGEPSPGSWGYPRGSLEVLWRFSGGFLGVLGGFPGSGTAPVPVRIPRRAAPGALRTAPLVPGKLSPALPPSPPGSGVGDLG